MITTRVLASSAIALAALASLALSGCGTKTERYQTAIRDCPTVSVLGNTGTVTKFGPGGPNSGPYLFRSDISGLRVKCDRERKNVEVEMSFLEVASRNEGVTQSTVEFPFFMAVMYRGKMIDKKIFTSKFEFAGNENRKGIVETFKTKLYFKEEGLSAKEQERLRKKRRNDPAFSGSRVDAQLADYEILIGFQLDKDELEYNVFN